MKNRREFLQAAVTGAVVLGSQSKLGLAGALEKHSGAKSKVVIARDPAIGTDSKPDEQKVLALLDRAIASYTGIHDQSAAWKHIVGHARTVGLKTNGLGGKGTGKGIATHAALIFAICERLQQAGVKPGNIVVWDRTRHDIEVLGLTYNTDPGKVRCYGSDTAGYEEQPVQFGTAKVWLSKILTRDCDMVINLPILKDHELAGVTFSMKNMYGVVSRPSDLHANNCNPAIADLNSIPTIRQKVRFTIGDALSAQYQGGPGFRPQYVWYPNALIVGEDRVAVDHTAWNIIERKRAEAGVPTLEAAGRPPHYIATAADAEHKLGTNDPQRIHLMEI